MRIALDYDDTYTRDPILWDHFIENVQKRGHYIAIVTFRSNNGYNSDIDEKIGDRIPVFYTAGHRKRAYCASKGFYPDVWIDDMPEIIVEEDCYVPGEMLARQLGYQKE